MTYEPSAYNITVRQITVDGETMFEARVMELPDVSGYGDSPLEAYTVAVDAIAELQANAAKDADESFPAPFEPELEYSGRFTLRMPKSVHRIWPASKPR